MAETRFTPGPWRVVERAPMEDGSVYPTHILGGAADFQVCLMEGAAVAALLHSGEWKTVVSTSAANAHLIAAVPELYAALDRLEVSANTVAYCYSKRPENFAQAFQQLRDDAGAARAALAKARGEQS